MSMPGEWDTAIATLSDATTIISNSSITSTSTSTSTKPRPSSSSSLVTTESHVYIRRKLLSRRSEFLRPNNVKIKAGTWNAGNYNCWEDIKDWFKHEEGYDVYALALQEVVDINQTANFIKYIGPTVALRWKANVQAALPEGFQCVASPQLIGMLLLVFVSPTLAHGSVSTSTVGTGLMGYVGNKGGVGVRLVLGDTLRLTFINCHLAAFANAVDRRNWDASEILRRMWFEAVEKEVVGLSPDPPANAITSTNGEGIDKTDVVIWCGDLNYRIDLENKDVRALLQPYMPADFPPAHNDAPSPKAASPPVPLPPTPTEAHPMAQTTLHGTIRSLLKHDQLLKARRAGKALADFKEGKVTFLPTYKYDVGKIGQWDSSEKARAPGWCDRILWRVKVPSSATEGPSTPTEDKRRTRSYSVASDVLAAAMRDEDEVLFETGFHDDENSGSENEDDEEDLVVSRAESPLPVYKPRNSMMSTTSRHSRNSSTDTVVYDDPSAVIATPFGDIIMEQLSYTSHQLVTSSDHKPVSATFSLTFPASVPDLRTKIHSEIAREVDKLENERRPVVTVIIDSTPSSDFVSFSPARYLLSQRRTITVANTGTTPAQLSFVATGTDNKICKPYYTLSIVDTASTPSNSSRLTTGTTLQPGDVINILITLLVANKADVIALNDKSAVLDDVLVLRIAGGRDIFIPISCTWLPCSYGTTLKELVRVPEGVGGFRGYKALPSIPDGPFYSAPREIYKITQFLCDGLADVVSTLWPDEKIEDKRWFSQLGWPFLESTWGYKDPERRRKVEIGVWEALDTDGEFEDVKTLRVAMDEEDEMVHKEELVEVAAEVVVKWLAGLTDGVIPEEMWDEVVKAGGEAKAAEQVCIHQSTCWLGAGKEKASMSYYL
ncbi:Endonuclease/exonuclease/phosphatase [Pyronema omphalodes]|nr:Endonuclease/exonuclease/phosphatase [Pyronema omphalodes]